MAYMKMLMQVLAAVLAAVVAALTGDQHIAPDEWISVATLGVGAAMVFAGPNVPGAPITKAVLSALATVLTGIAAAISGGITVTEWLMVGMGALGTVMVYLAPNTGAPVVVEHNPG